MSLHVIDTNVLVTADGRADHVSDLCQTNCIQFLADARSAGHILVDDQHLILGEYLSQLRHGGQSGAGWAFYKWLHDHRNVRMPMVQITPIPGSDEDYEEFPHTGSLVGFDRSDRKFVAVARASGKNPPIANATDSDWADFHGALRDAGITVQFLCPADCAPA